jgi:hypothetical protein
VTYLFLGREFSPFFLRKAFADVGEFFFVQFIESVTLLFEREQNIESLCLPIRGPAPHTSENSFKVFFRHAPIIADPATVRQLRSTDFPA